MSTITRTHKEVFRFFFFFLPSTFVRDSRNHYYSMWSPLFLIYLGDLSVRFSHHLKKEGILLVEMPVIHRFFFVPVITGKSTSSDSSWRVQRSVKWKARGQDRSLSTRDLPNSALKGCCHRWLPHESTHFRITKQYCLTTFLIVLPDNWSQCTIFYANVLYTPYRVASYPKVLRLSSSKSLSYISFDGTTAWILWPLEIRCPSIP